MGTIYPELVWTYHQSFLEANFGGYWNLLPDLDSYCIQLAKQWDLNHTWNQIQTIQIHHSSA